jgi:two-component system, cell cycle response regulator DivK
MPKILLVDDEENNRLIITHRLQRRFEVLQAETAEQGLDLAARERPDLILMDLRLPGLDGYGAIRRLKADPASRTIPIIAVTSYALPGDEASAREAGCDGYLTKPFDPARLERMIDELLV